MIKIALLLEEIINADLPINTLYGYSSPMLADILPLVETLDLEQVIWITPLTANEQITFDTIVNNHNSNNLTQIETVKNEIDTANGQIKTLPEWSTWTPQEAENNVINKIFNGRTLESIQADIDNINNIAGVKIALSSMTGAIISIRGILAVMAKIVIYIFKLLR